MADVDAALEQQVLDVPQTYYKWRRKLREAAADPAPDHLAGPGFAAAVMIEDAEAAHPGLQPAMIIDLARGKRISIFASASPALVGSALKALR